MAKKPISSKVVEGAVEYVKRQKQAAECAKHPGNGVHGPVPTEHQPENWWKEGWIKEWPEHYVDIWPKGH